MSDKAKVILFFSALLTIGAFSLADTGSTNSNTITSEKPAVESVLKKPAVIAKPIVPAESAPAKETASQAALKNVTPVTNYGAPNGYYVNVDSQYVPRPYKAPVRPSGASARCRDGSYSFSQNRRGTCSHHGGVSTWY